MRSKSQAFEEAMNAAGQFSFGELHVSSADIHAISLVPATGWSSVVAVGIPVAFLLVEREFHERLPKCVLSANFEPNGNC